LGSQDASRQARENNGGRQSKAPNGSGVIYATMMKQQRRCDALTWLFPRADNAGSNLVCSFAQYSGRIYRRLLHEKLNLSIRTSTEIFLKTPLCDQEHILLNEEM